MNRFFVLGVLVVVSLFSFGHIAAAQPEATMPPVAEETVNAAQEAVSEAEDDNLMYTYGTVISVSADSIVINEYDFDSDSFKEITYALTPDVKFSNVSAMTDIVAGDSVEIYYVVEGDKKVAKTIGKDEEEILDEEEGAEPSEGMAPMMDEIPEPAAPAADAGAPMNATK